MVTEKNLCAYGGKFMRLYKTELYKLCHKKFFVVGIICTLAFLFLLFYQNLAAQKSAINGVEYHGYEAVKTDRQITEEYKGALTDEKLQQIVDKYGFPQRMVEYYGFADGNFLNQFVMTYASDGYYYGWDDYQLATKVLSIENSKLSNIRTATGGDIWLAYYAGWDYFTSWYYTGMIMVSIVVLCLVSTVFSNEEQAGTKPLLFTTKEGPAKDTHAKIAAAFTLSVGLWLCVTVFCFLLNCLIYGWDGLKCLSELVLGWGEPVQSFGVQLIEVFLLSLLGLLELCAITLWISAHCRSTFHSVSAAAICWIMPILAFMVLGGVYQILTSSSFEYSVLYILAIILFVVHLSIYSSPFYLIHKDIISELNALSFNTGSKAYLIVLIFTVVITVLCAAGGYRRYRKIRRK